MTLWYFDSWAKSSFEFRVERLDKSIWICPFVAPAHQSPENLYISWLKYEGKQSNLGTHTWQRKQLLKWGSPATANSFSWSQSQFAGKFQRAHQCHSMLTNRIGASWHRHKGVHSKSDHVKTGIWYMGSQRKQRCLILDHLNTFHNLFCCCVFLIFCSVSNFCWMQALRISCYRRERVPLWCHVALQLSDPHDRSRHNVMRSSERQPRGLETTVKRNYKKNTNKMSWRLYTAGFVFCV